MEAFARGAVQAAALQIGAGALAAVALARHQLAAPAPLVPVDLLRIPAFGLSVATSICSFAAQMLAFASLPFHLHDVLGRGAVQIGLLMTPWPLATSVAAPVAGLLADRVAAGLLGSLGLLVLAAGLALLAVLPPDAASTDIAWRMAVCGAGFGLFQAPNNRTMLSAAPRHRSGAAGGMLATARLLGQTAGTTAVVVLFRLRPQQATTLALGLAACLAVVAAAVSALRLRPQNHPNK